MSRVYLDERVFAHAAAHADAPAVCDSSGWHTYSALAGEVNRLAVALQARGVDRGHTVLNLLPGGFASVAAGLAIQRTGACLVEVNRDWGRAFIAGVAAATGARYAFGRAVDRALLDDVTLLEPAAMDPAPAGAACVPPPREPDDLALVLFTSASTGRPRGVKISHANVAANSASIVGYLELGPGDRVMSILPLTYSYGRSLLQTHLWVGGSICFDARFMYPRLVLEAIARERCTGFAGVPLTFEILRQKCDPRTIAMPALRYVTQAGGPMSSALRLWARDAFAPARFFVMYGQTEATARLAYLPPERLVEKPDAVGVAIPGVELKVVDEAGREVEAGSTGNLVARGANVTSGYLDDPEATRDILRDGWLWTGDIARRDEDGDFYVVGRKRTMLKVSGHRFAPEEVEAHLERHPDVKEACVVAMPDATTEQSVCAFVVLTSTSDTAALRRHCAEALPVYKRPKRIVVVDALPRSAAGKVRRIDLEQRALQLA